MSEVSDYLDHLGGVLQDHSQSLWLEVLKSFRPIADDPEQQRKAIQVLQGTILRAMAGVSAELLGASEEDI
jgi:hypothetical protein